MSKKYIFPFVAILILFVGLDANAFTIKKGAVSFGGSSSLSAINSDSDRMDSTNSIGTSATIGYFLMDNFEFGGELNAFYRDLDDGESKSISLSPFVTYHFELNEKSNIYLTGMIGISKSYYDRNDYSAEDDGIILSSEIGWEYFFSPSVSGTVGLRYDRVNADYDVDYDTDGYYYDGDDSDTYTTFGTVIGFKIYF